MEPVPENVESAEVPAADTVTEEAPVVAEPVAAPVPVPVVEEPAVVATVAPPAPAPTHPFVSLYDGVGTTLLAILLGVGIVGGIQMIVARIFVRERNPHRALTQFVTAMVAIMVGVYVSDMLIAGPTAELLGESERSSILGFVKDTALMIFAYYFGTQSSASKED
jgi:hypothetical protein